MSKPDTITIDGNAFDWQRLLELRRQQVEAWRAAQPRQLALFDLKHDCRPQTERTAPGRYEEPSLFTAVTDPRKR
jgi:hypothetical protein